LEKQEKSDVIRDKMSAIDSEISDSYAQMLKKNNCEFLVPTGTGVLIDPNKMPSDKAAVEKCMQVKQLYEDETKLKAYKLSEKDNKFTWPVQPSRGVSTYFRDEEYYQILGSEHIALDIPAAQGTEIHSPAAGYVYFINPPVPGGYAYMAVKHSGGFVTVYGHVSEVSVKQFQFVQAGDVIGKSGGAK